MFIRWGPFLLKGTAHKEPVRVYFEPGDSKYFLRDQISFLPVPAAFVFRQSHQARPCVDYATLQKETRLSPVCNLLPLEGIEKVSNYSFSYDKEALVISS